MEIANTGKLVGHVVFSVFHYKKSQILQSIIMITQALFKKIPVCSNNVTAKLYSHIVRRGWGISRLIVSSVCFERLKEIVEDVTLATSLSWKLDKIVR